MRVTLLKYLMMTTCILCMLEGAGVPLSAAFSNHHRQSEWQAAATEDDDATERSEKEVNLKEFYADTQLVFLLPQYALSTQSAYIGENHCHHLGWIPPVPTPPPNSFA